VKASDKVYWIKVGGAVIVGILTALANKNLGLEGNTTFMLGIIIYIIFSEALAIVTKIDRSRTLRIGVGAFVFIWVVVWTLINTILTV
jgi:hypothetical protein